MEILMNILDIPILNIPFYIVLMIMGMFLHLEEPILYLFQEGHEIELAMTIFAIFLVILFFRMWYKFHKRRMKWIYQILGTQNITSKDVQKIRKLLYKIKENPEILKGL